MGRRTGSTLVTVTIGSYQQSDYEDDQEQNEKGNLHLRVVCKTKKNKFSDSGVIFTNHILGLFLSKNQCTYMKIFLKYRHLKRHH